MSVQTRSESTEIKQHTSVSMAFAYAAEDPTVWKISFLWQGERVRLVSRGDGTWAFESLKSTQPSSSQSDSNDLSDSSSEYGDPRNLQVTITIRDHDGIGWSRLGEVTIDSKAESLQDYKNAIALAAEKAHHQVQSYFKKVEEDQL